MSGICRQGGDGGSENEIDIIVDVDVPVLDCNECCCCRSCRSSWFSNEKDIVFSHFFRGGERRDIFDGFVVRNDSFLDKEGRKERQKEWRAGKAGGGCIVESVGLMDWWRDRGIEGRERWERCFGANFLDRMNWRSGDGKGKSNNCKEDSMSRIHKPQWRNDNENDNNNIITTTTIIIIIIFTTATTKKKPSSMIDFPLS